MTSRYTRRRTNMRRRRTVNRRHAFRARRVARKRRSFATRRRHITVGRFNNVNRDNVQVKFPFSFDSNLSALWVPIPTVNASMVFSASNSGNTGFYIQMNANPNFGNMIFFNTGTLPQFSPQGQNAVSANHQDYMPIGCKVTIDLIPNNVATLASPEAPAPSYKLIGFPFCYSSPGSESAKYGNSWNGSGSSNLNPLTVPSTKYGFEKFFIGRGGPGFLRFSHYYDFSKILGISKSQYNANITDFACPIATGSGPGAQGSNPTVALVLGLGLYDTTNADTLQEPLAWRIRLTQYGRAYGIRLNLT